MTVFWILLIPLGWLLAAKFLLRTTFNWKELGISMVIVSILTTVTWQLGKYGQTIDTEILNGAITEKVRHHDDYIRSYSCNCYESCSGSGKNRSCTTTCSTCYEDHYTVTWFAKSTLGNIQFKHRDSTSRSVYLEPDPISYTRCKVGEPASRTNTYTNYVQAVPESLFHDDSTTAKQFEGQIPNYPVVYDHYKFNRVISVGAGSITANEIFQLDALLDNELRTLGASKQANIIVILTSIADSSYRYALENAWLGGKKNDIVVFIGLDGKNIIWADVMTWALNSGNELFNVTMRDVLNDLKIFKVDEVGSTIVNTVNKLYDRPQMKDYEYLADDIDPPTWVIWLAVFFAFGGSVILTFIFHKHEI